jgi:hypothetical protein
VLWYGVNVLKNKSLLDLASKIGKLSDMPIFLQFWNMAMQLIPEATAAEVYSSIDQCLDRGELLVELNRLGGTKKMTSTHSLCMSDADLTR